MPIQLEILLDLHTQDQLRNTRGERLDGETAAAEVNHMGCRGQRTGRRDRFGGNGRARPLQSMSLCIRQFRGMNLEPVGMAQQRSRNIRMQRIAPRKIAEDCSGIRRGRYRRMLENRTVRRLRAPRSIRIEQRKGEDQAGIGGKHLRQGVQRWPMAGLERGVHDAQGFFFHERRWL